MLAYGGCTIAMMKKGDKSNVRPERKTARSDAADTPDAAYLPPRTTMADNYTPAPSGGDAQIGQFQFAPSRAIGNLRSVDEDDQYYEDGEGEEGEGEEEYTEEEEEFTDEVEEYGEYEEGEGEDEAEYEQGEGGDEVEYGEDGQPVDYSEQSYYEDDEEEGSDENQEGQPTWG
jgi:hypothetical protein